MFYEIKNVSFQYSNDSPVLFQNVNLSLQSDESIAIIGPSGCGKSTFLKVALSLLEPVNGDILMKGFSVGKVGTTAYRQKVGAVLQDDGLMTGSIADNISFFDPQPDQKRIEEGAKIAAIHYEIMGMPMRYQTLVGNLGSALSGGQIQRILLARALYKNPSLLFLDEATSHLDINNERKINQSIRDMKIGRIIISHRPETVSLADRVYLLTRNGLVEQSKESLLSNVEDSVSMANYWSACNQ